MPRPFLTFPTTFEAPIHYGRRMMPDGQLAQIVCGTLPTLQPTDLDDFVRRIMPERRIRDLKQPFLHATISLPPDMRPTLEQWREILHLALGALGFPPMEVPWQAAAHTDTSCLHVHCVVVCTTFSGRSIVFTDKKARCERADIAVSRYLGLPEPKYFSPKAWPSLDIFAPGRRLAKRPELPEIFQCVFRVIAGSNFR